MDKSKNLYIVTCVHEHTGQRRVRFTELSKLADVIDVLIGVGYVILTVVQVGISMGPPNDIAEAPQLTC